MTTVLILTVFWEWMALEMANTGGQEEVGGPQVSLSGSEIESLGFPQVFFPLHFPP